MGRAGSALAVAFLGSAALCATADAATLVPIGTATYSAPTYVTSDPRTPIGCSSPSSQGRSTSRRPAARRCSSTSPTRSWTEASRACGRWRSPPISRSAACSTSRIRPTGTRGDHARRVPGAGNARRDRSHPPRGARDRQQHRLQQPQRGPASVRPRRLPLLVGRRGRHRAGQRAGPRQPAWQDPADRPAWRPAGSVHGPARQSLRRHPRRAAGDLDPRTAQSVALSRSTG